MLNSEPYFTTKPKTIYLTLKCILSINKPKPKIQTNKQTNQSITGYPNAKWRGQKDGSAVKILVGSSEDPGLVASIHVAAHSCL